MSIPQRLKEVRAAKHLNQTAFGALGGVSKTTQKNYESGLYKPTVDYLEALAAAGVDVYYLLTGERDSKLLTERQRHMLALFDGLTEEAQTALLEGLDAGRPGRIAAGQDRRIKENERNTVKSGLRPPPKN